MLFSEDNSIADQYSIAETDANNILDLNRSADGGSFILQLNSPYLTVNEVNNYLSMENNVDRFLHINCRSLPKHFDEIKSLINYVSKPLTVLAISETWLKPFNEDIFQLPGYSFVSCLRPTATTGGGVGLYINNCEQYKTIPDLTLISDVIECIFVEIIRHNRSNLIVGCIYRPHSADLYEFNNVLTNIFRNNYFIGNKGIFVLGDFNINLLQFESHVPTANFLNSMLSFGLIPAINKPTRITNTSKTLIDNIFTNCNVFGGKSALLYSDISDHLPIILECKTIKNAKIKTIQKSTEISRRTFHQSSIDKFKFYLCNTDWDSIISIEDGSDSNAIYKRFINTFNVGFNQYFP